MEFNCPGERNHEKDCCWWPVFQHLEKKSSSESSHPHGIKEPFSFLSTNNDLFICSAGNNSGSPDIVRPNFENVSPISHYDQTWWPHISPAYLELKPCCQSINYVQSNLWYVRPKDLKWHMSCQWRNITSSTAYVHTTTFPPPPL